MSSIFPPTDLLPPRRGGHPSPSTASAAARPAGFARLAGARRGLFRSARALAAAALLALTGALALPATAEAQTDNTAPTLSAASVSNYGIFVKLTFSEDLDLPDGPLSETAQAAFSLIVDGNAQMLSPDNSVRRDTAPFLSGCESRPATVAPAGSSRSGRWR